MNFFNDSSLRTIPISSSRDFKAGPTIALFSLSIRSINSPRSSRTIASEETLLVVWIYSDNFTGSAGMTNALLE